MLYSLVYMLSMCYVDYPFSGAVCCPFFSCMNSQPRHVYTSFDKRWRQVMSKEDIIQVLVDVGSFRSCVTIERMEARRCRTTAAR